MSAPDAGLTLPLPREQLARLLERECRLYAMDLSSSLPEETVQQLLDSLLYTLSQPGLPQGEPESRLRAGRQLLERKCAAAKSLWEALTQSPPPFGSETLGETLASIGAGFRRYDVRFCAHEFPCAIDYPLCCAVPETRQGVDYVLDYLRRAAAEHALLCRVEQKMAERVLRHDCADFAALPVNLCAPVLVQAIGRTLLGLAPAPLDLTGAQLDALSALLTPLSPAALRATLIRAADRLCRQLDLPDPFVRQYLQKAAAAEAPRIAASGDLSGVFYAE